MLILLILLKVLLYLLLFIIGLALLLLLIPFNYKGKVLAADGFRAQLSFGWAGRLLGIKAELEGEAYDVSLTVLDRKIYKFKTGSTGEQEEQAEPSLEEKAEGRKEKKGPSLKELANRTLINEIIDYFKRLLGIIKPRYLHLCGTYGFEDPSLTGIVSGTAGIIKGIIPYARLELTPDFTREIIDLELRAEGSVSAGNIAYQTLRTVLKKPVREILFRKKKS